MAPKTVCNAAKLVTILNYFHTSGVAHSIKDLERILPSIASINGMAVKDYLQALSDENQIKVEKIGSGNWYWSFAGEEKREKEKLLEKATEEWVKANAAVQEMKVRVEDAEKAREVESDGGGESRVNLLKWHGQLSKEVQELKEELASHCDNDPAEIEKRDKETNQLKLTVEKWTDQILEMEKWLKDTAGMDREALNGLKRELYGQEYDEEEEGLKEL